jgi:flagellar biosynthesis protein FlhB
MPSDEQGERTESPTQRRREESRERGQVAHSADLSSALVLLGALGALNFLGGRIFTQLAAMTADLLDVSDAPAWDIGQVGQTFRTCLWGTATILVPLLATIMVSAILSNLLQTGLLFTGEPLKPNLSKISPLAGLKRMFSRRSLVRLGMSMGKVAIVGAVGYVTIAGGIERILATSGMAYQQVVTLAGEMVLALCLRIAVVLLVLALLDYIFQRWQHEQDLMMTRQELKEDLKRMEGDPQIRARRQRVARQLAMQRMSREVPRSTVVVTNPTHLSVALLYHEDMNAPKVVAKGSDLMAIRIRQIAAASGVPIVERKPLAQALYKSCDVGDEVPVSLYKAVAEVLAYVYELARHKKIGRRIPAGVS